MTVVFSFFKEKNHQDLLIEQSKQVRGSIQPTLDENLKDQLRILDLTEEDLAVAQILKPYVEQNIEKIVGRSEERRVGKECRSRGEGYQEKKNKDDGDGERGWM